MFIYNIKSFENAKRMNKKKNSINKKEEKKMSEPISHTCNCKKPMCSGVNVDTQNITTTSPTQETRPWALCKYKGPIVL